MRVYLSPALQKLLSMATLCFALGAFGLVLWKAFDIWTSDPVPEQTQQIQDDQKP